MGNPPFQSTRDKLLFTPGPLTTSPTVKQAMLRDFGSRDTAFIALVRDVRDRLLGLAEADPSEYAAIPMQGSGTFGLEAVLASVVPATGKLLVLVNGAYGRRLVTIAQRLGIGVQVAEWDENMPVDPVAVEKLLAEGASITHVSVCHCETTSGVMNPVQAIGEAVRAAGRCFFVDAMSSFGAVPTNLGACGIDYLVSSSNKCIEGVPGFSFVLARLSDLEASEGTARSVSLDLLAQYRGLESNGQFRFTPPTHAMLAFHQALLELEAEGGVAGRAARYGENHRVLLAGMKAMGFRPYVAEEHQGYIITSFHYPGHPSFVFETFYRLLSERGQVIYPGKVTGADCFRIGNIGRLFPSDMEVLLDTVAHVLQAMGVESGGAVEEFS